MAESKTKILVAEDDSFLQKVYMTKLTQEGFLVEVASDGEEALKQLRNSPPDLLLLDLIMPRVNGFDVLQEMKDDNQLKKIPVVVLSNLGQPEDIQKCRELGAKDYLVKANFSINAVVEKIRQYVKNGWKKTAGVAAPAPAPSLPESTAACVKCGKIIPADAKFCPYCAAAQKKSQ